MPVTGISAHVPMSGEEAAGY